MKNAKLVTFLWSSLLSFCLSLSAAMWLVTAFNLGVDTGLLTVFCLIASLLCSLCYTLPHRACHTDKNNQTQHPRQYSAHNHREQGSQKDLQKFHNTYILD
jgi:hypothetical protein